MKATFLIAILAVMSGCSAPSDAADSSRDSVNTNVNASEPNRRISTLGQLKAEGYVEVGREPMMSSPSKVNGSIAEGALGTAAIVMAKGGSTSTTAATTFRCIVPASMNFEREWSVEEMSGWRCEQANG